MRNNTNKQPGKWITWLSFPKFGVTPPLLFISPLTACWQRALLNLRSRSNSAHSSTGHSAACVAKTAINIISHIAVAACMSFEAIVVMADSDKPISPQDFSRMTLEDLANIEVTSVSKGAERFIDAPASINVITSEDIRRSGATSIPEALRLADNLNVAQKNSHDWGISARGFNTELANKLLVLIDGRTVYTPLFSGVFWDRQDYLLADIDRIEVISGPGSTLWGANAVNGVINIITKAAADTQGTYLEASAGSKLQSSTAVRYGGKLASNVSFRVYGKYFERDNQVFGNGDDASDSWDMNQGGFRIDADVSAQDKFTLQGDMYSGDEDIPTGGDSGVRGGNILGRWSHTISNDSDMSLQFYYDQTHFSLPKPANIVAPAGILRDDLDTYDLDFQHRFRLGERNKIVWGLGYRFTHDVVDNAPSTAVLPARLDQDLYSGFIQDEIKLHEKLFLTVGTKIEHTEFTGWEVEPSGRLQWNFADNQMLWAAVSHAVRTPSRLDRGLKTPTNLPAPFPDSLLSGNPDFVSETVTAYELGYRAQLTPKFFTSISAFYNEYDDVRSITPTSPFVFPLVIDNNVEGETYGVELSANLQVFDWWRLHFGYSYLEENLRVKPGEVDFTNALNETSDPREQFSIRSSMNLPYSVEFDANFRWVDTLHNVNGFTPGTVPSYSELDLRLGWRPVKKLELSVVGQNLLHDQHPEFGFPNSAREEIERSIYGKVRWEF